MYKRKKTLTPIDILKKELNKEKDNLYLANEMIKHHTDKWVKSQKAIIKLEESIEELSKNA